MKLSALLVNATLIFSTALAFSSPADEAGLEARGRPRKPKNPKPATVPVPAPTDADVKAHYEHIAADTCLFYARVGTEADVKKVRNERTYLKNYRILEERWTDRWYQTAKNQMGGRKGQKKFFEMASRVLAKECKGTVYVLLPDGQGKDWPADTIWAKEEYPNLADSTKVIRLNMQDANHQEVIWDGSGKRSVALEEDLEVELEGELEADLEGELEEELEETLEARMADKPESVPTNSNDAPQGECTVQVSQWEHGDDDEEKRFELEFSVRAADGGRVLAHQPRVFVTDGQPLPSGSATDRRFAARDFFVIPSSMATSDGLLAFSYGTLYWAADDASRCALDPWAAADEEEGARHREVRCHFAC